MNITFYIFRSLKPDFNDIRVAADSLEQAQSDISHGYEFTGKIVTEKYIHASLFGSVAAELPGKWTIKPLSKEHTDSSFYLVREDGLTIFGNPNGYGHENKLGLSWSSNRELRDVTHIGSATIYVSIWKTAQQIAKDIVRRLLPECETFHASQNAALAKQNERITQRDSVRKTICELLGKPERPEKDREETYYGEKFTVTLGYSGNVTIAPEHMGIEKAEKLIKFLKTL